ncbi:MAG: hypothetical protein AB8B56_15645 [Crocinitomicaceae bacterium]
MKHNVLFLALGFLLLSCNGSLNDHSKSSLNTNKIDPALHDSLKNVILDLSRVGDEIPGDYLTHFGFRDWYRWPLVFPYSLNSIDSQDDGFICDERLAENISGSQKGIDQIYLGDIKKFTFNAEVLIAETGDKGSKKYKMLRFSDKKITNYASSFELFEASDEYDDMIMDSLITLREYSLLFR